MVYDMDKINELIDDYADKSFEAGRLDERERIIALLEAEGCRCLPEAGRCYPHNLIALIKGETE